MPSVAYANTIKGEAEGEGVTFGPGAIVTVGFEVSVAGVEQDVNNTASKQSPGMIRCISFRGREVVLGDRSHETFTEALLSREMLSFIVFRILGVTGILLASMPRMTAPMTGGTVSRTKRALGAS